MPSDYTMKQRARRLAKTQAVTLPPAPPVEHPKPVQVEHTDWLLGLDPSHWSNVIDWQIAKEAGVSFAIIKAKNSIYTSQFFKENYRGAKDAGIIVSAYQWLYPAEIMSPGRQAREFANLLRDYPVDFAPAVDFEWTYPINPDVGDLYGMVVPLSEATNFIPIAYSAPGYWSQYGSRNPFWTRFPLWQAQYRKSTTPMLPWPDWTFWQFTETAPSQKYGFRRDGERRCTLNYFRGSIDDLRRVGTHA